MCRSGIACEVSCRLRTQDVHATPDLGLARELTTKSQMPMHFAVPKKIIYIWSVISSESFPQSFPQSSTAEPRAVSTDALRAGTPPCARAVRAG